jgi:hypothetical protein
MANIRIKDLSTTASTTASDDFFGVDGATNGTRKLNAYSPTFGGNLTLAGYLQLAAGKQVYADILAPSSGTTLTLGSGSGQTATVTGNLTVSGTGNSSIGGTLLVNGASPSGNGAIQLATHTTSAGGIGFGTETALYRYGAGRLGLSHIGGSTPILYLLEGTTETARLWTANGPCYLDTLTAQPIYFRPNGTTALTLDSSQNATFAGRITVNGTGTSAFNVGNSGQVTVASNGAATDAPLQLSNTAQNWQVRLNGANGSLWFYNVTGGAVPLTLGTDSNATFAGSLTTAAPSGGTAGAWKLGVRVAATTTLDTTQYLQVDIGGTLYKVALVTS